jgi:UDP-N-acetylmuramate dehydrogenase
MQDFKKHLNDACRFDANSANFSYWRIGGPVALLVQPRSIEELALAVKLSNIHQDTPSLVVGDGSNLLYDTRGFQGILIKIGNELSNIKIDESTVACDAGVWVPELAYKVSTYGLSGIEHICGIPGRLGGLIYMNGGADRRSILENIISVELINENGDIETEYSGNLQFAYRTSPFQNDRRIIARATLQLSQSHRKVVRAEMRKKLASRRERFPRKLPNCGSVFLSDPNIYEQVGTPGFAIESVGLKGVTKGGAQISTQHANFIINTGNATSDDVLFLIKLMRQEVYLKTGFKMSCEARYVSVTGELLQAHIPAENIGS